MRQIRSATRRVGREFRILIAILPLLGAAIPGIAIVSMLADGRVRSEDFILMPILAGIIALLVALAVGIYAGRGFAGPRKVAPVIRDHGLCACCGLDLASIPIDSDGFATCTQCAAAWSRPNANPVASRAPSQSVEG